MPQKLATFQESIPKISPLHISSSARESSGGRTGLHISYNCSEFEWIIHALNPDMLLILNQLCYNEIFRIEIFRIIFAKIFVKIVFI